MSKKTKNHKEIKEAIDVISEHDYTIGKARSLLDKLTDNMTRTEKERYPDLMEELRCITY